MSIESISSIVSIPEGKLLASVVSFETCESKDKDGSKQKYTTFKIQVKSENQVWYTERRYNEFDRLNSELKKSFPDLKLKFPGKNYFGDNFNIGFITKRMNGLNEFIKDALSYPAVIKSPNVWEFLSISEYNLNSFKKSFDSEKNVQTNTNRESRRRVSDENEHDSGEEINLGTSNNPVAKPTDFEFLSVIGKGSFGKVYMANHKFENKIYAIKVLNKEAIIKRNEVKHIMAERNVLIRNLKHPFLVGLHYSFQSNDKLYFVLDYVNGGELFFHLLRQRSFPEPRVKFYAAEISHAIGYMHSKEIIYRDLKPENILIDSYGHIKLTDFGLCKEGIQANTTTTTFCGTPEYLAPEILLKKPYTRAVDWWCLGSVIYEMLYGLPPFYSRDTNEMYNNILYRPLRLNSEIPVSSSAKNIIVELLQKEQQRRLGYSESDFVEIRDHSFFHDLSWSDLIENKIPVPWIPTLDSKTDLQHIDPEFTREQISSSLGKSLISSYRTQGQNAAFSGFTYAPEKNLNQF